MQLPCARSSQTEIVFARSLPDAAMLPLVQVALVVAMFVHEADGSCTVSGVDCGANASCQDINAPGARYICACDAGYAGATTTDGPATCSEVLQLRRLHDVAGSEHSLQPCYPARSSGCIVRRFLSNEPKGFANAHEFLAKAVNDEGDPLGKRLFQ